MRSTVVPHVKRHRPAAAQPEPPASEAHVCTALLDIAEIRPALWIDRTDLTIRALADPAPWSAA